MDILLNHKDEIELIVFDYGFNDSGTVLTDDTMCSKTMENIENIASGVLIVNNLINNYDGTKLFHDQQNSELCVIFTITSALRHSIIKVVEREGKPNSDMINYYNGCSFFKYLW